MIERKEQVGEKSERVGKGEKSGEERGRGEEKEKKKKREEEQVD